MPYVPADPLRSSARSSLARRIQQLLFDLLLNRTIEVNAILFEMLFVVASILYVLNVYYTILIPSIPIFCSSDIYRLDEFHDY